MAIKPNNGRIGFHYYPDTLHYREKDLTIWLPILQALHVRWLVLDAPLERAIPEFFINELIQSGIQPVLRFQAIMVPPPKTRDLKVLFEMYSRWGASYVIVFDRPNLRTNWPAASWAQSNLVERFLDTYLPLAQEARESGLTPAFPPLEPGGDYWDTAFLRAALQGMLRRGFSAHELPTLTAYARAGNLPLNWGAGGPERWPLTRPYSSRSDTQDQRGFCIYDWYLAISEAVFGEACPIILLESGSRLGDRTDPNNLEIDASLHAERNNVILNRLLNPSSAPDSSELEPIPEKVIACNFWLLAAAPDSPFAKEAWFQPDGSVLPVLNGIKKWEANLDIESLGFSLPSNKPIPHAISIDESHPVRHYLLLPVYDWGTPDWLFDAIRPFVKKYNPTIGFSLLEATHAARVTLLGDETVFPTAMVQQLLDSGCIVERVSGDGTKIASTLANL